MIVEIVYDATPPSLNTTGTRGSHWVTTKLKKKWQRVFEALLMAERLPHGLAHVEATARLRFPVKRRRDADNFSWLTSKALGDALVNGGWLADDTPEFFRFKSVEFDPERGPAQTVVRLTVTKAAA